MMKRSEISEEIRWVWNCPECGYCNEGSDDPDYEDEVSCEECNKTFEIEEDDE